MHQRVRRAVSSKYDNPRAAHFHASNSIRLRTLSLSPARSAVRIRRTFRWQINSTMNSSFASPRFFFLPLRRSVVIIIAGPVRMLLRWQEIVLISYQANFLVIKTNMFTHRLTLARARRRPGAARRRRRRARARESEPLGAEHSAALPSEVEN